MGRNSVESQKVREVKSWLCEFRQGERDIDNQIVRLEALETRLYSLSSPRMDGIGGHSNYPTDKLSLMVEKRDQQKRKVEMMIEKQQTKRIEMENKLGKIKDPDERAVIEMRYMDGETWSDVSEMLFGEKKDFDEKRDSYLRRTTKLHGRALQSITKLNA